MWIKKCCLHFMHLHIEWLSYLNAKCIKVAAFFSSIVNFCNKDNKQMININNVYHKKLKISLTNSPDRNSHFIVCPRNWLIMIASSFIFSFNVVLTQSPNAFSKFNVFRLHLNKHKITNFKHFEIKFILSPIFWCFWQSLSFVSSCPIVVMVCAKKCPIYFSFWCYNKYGWN